MKRKISLLLATLSKDGNIKSGNYILGTWRKRDLWAESHAPKGYDRSGNKLVHYIWEAELVDGTKFTWCYTLKDLREEVKNAVVEIEI